MAYGSAVREQVAALVRGAMPGRLAGAAPLFLAWHIGAGLLGFAAIPFVLLAHPAPSGPLLLLFAWPLLPLLVALDLVKRQDLARANLLSAAAIAAAAAIVMLAGGDATALALAWLLLPPVQAVLTAPGAAVPTAGLSTATALLLVALHLLGGNAGAALPLALVPVGLVLIAMAVYAAALFRQRDETRDRAAAADRAEDARHRLVDDSVSDLVTQHGSNGAVLAASLSAENLAGAAAEALLGQGLFQRVHVADRPAFLDALARAGVGAAATVEFRLRHGALGAEAAPPRFVWVEMRCAPVRGAAAPAEGGRYPVVAVSRDIGERKAREDELVEARREAERANAAKSLFHATMSHELRTPLNAIIGFSEMLAGAARTPLDDARRQEYAGLIHQSGQHLLSVVNGILDMSNIEAGSFAILPEPLALAPLVAGCVKLLALKAAESGVLLEVKLAEPLPDLVADPRACKQILLNLVSNAIKFSRVGGRVTIRATLDGEAVLLTVADTGVGIAAEDLPRLGAPFFQARSSYDRPYEGTGLGLSVVKGLTELHGGRLSIESRPGLGTSVTVRLPLVAAGASVPAPEASADEAERAMQRA
jgi:cell cycle sensor histidine kinase DivJ